jgi:hypothetical protein
MTTRATGWSSAFVVVVRAGPVRQESCAEHQRGRGPWTATGAREPGARQVAGATAGAMDAVVAPLVGVPAGASAVVVAGPVVAVPVSAVTALVEEASAAAGRRPSAAVSPVPSAARTGIVDGVPAVRQVPSLTGAMRRSQVPDGASRPSPDCPTTYGRPTWTARCGPSCAR